MHFNIYTPTAGAAELRYVLEYFFTSLFHFPFVIIQEEERKHITIQLEDRKMHFPAHFFVRSDQNWGQKLAIEPKDVSNTFAEQFVVLFNESGHFSENGNEANLDADIFGSSFYLLSGYEEFCSSERDAHHRFLLQHSWLKQNNWILRPLVNEYLVLLQSVLNHFFGTQLKIEREFAQYLSCDVDIPYAPYLYSNKKLIKTIAGDVLKRKSFSLAWQKVQEKIRFMKKGKAADPNHTFAEYFIWKDKYEVDLAFYFIAQNTAGKIDEDYQLTDVPVQEIMKDLVLQGAEIGLHGSYLSYNDGDLLKGQKEKLQDAIKNQHQNVEIIGNRMHFLRWDAVKTVDALEQAQFFYDTTLGFADHIGFRRGICYPFPLYHLQERRKTKVIERPLLIMDVSLLSKNYMQLSYPVAQEKCISLKHEVLRYQGDFTVLWHNSNFTSPQDILLVEKIVGY